MEVDIENIQFTKYCVQLTGSLIKWIVITLRYNICYIFCSFVLVIGVVTYRLGTLRDTSKERL